MAELIIRTNKIKENIKSLSEYFESKNIKWSLITKVFSGDTEFLKNVLTDDVIENINSVGDSRLTSLKNLKEVNPEMRTIYIKPPAAIYADAIVEYADISLNSSFSTIEALNNAASKKGKVHKIIIMVELGELREGVDRDDLLAFYETVFKMEFIEVIGIGSNLGCMYGVEPSYDKLLQLSLYRELISTKFKRDLPLISAGTSITLQLVEDNNIPKDINHFRIGEAAFFGLSPLKNERFRDLNTDTFEFSANIIELEQKKLLPDGIINDANIGHAAEQDQKIGVSEVSYKAILDFGLLDVNVEDIDCINEEIEFVGVTSDMTVVDLKKNKNSDGTDRYKVGDQLKFTPNYMAVARLLNSKFIEKVFVDID